MRCGAARSAWRAAGTAPGRPRPRRPRPRPPRPRDTGKGSGGVGKPSELTASAGAASPTERLRNWPAARLRRSRTSGPSDHAAIASSCSLMSSKTRAAEATAAVGACALDTASELSLGRAERASPSLVAPPRRPPRVFGAVGVGERRALGDGQARTRSAAGGGSSVWLLAAALERSHDGIAAVGGGDWAATARAHAP